MVKIVKHQFVPFEKKTDFVHKVIEAFRYTVTTKFTHSGWRKTLCDKFAKMALLLYYLLFCDINSWYK